MFAMAKGNMRRFGSLLLAFALCMGVLWVPAAPGALAAKDYSTVRVKLSNANDGTINLRFTGDYSIEQNGATVTGDVLLTLGGSGLTVSNKSTGAQIYTGKNVRFNRTGNSGTFRMYTTANGNNQYLGDLLVTAEGSGFTAVNYIPMDHYLYGVVAYEMNNSWPLEALKAQAVAARGYAADCVGRYGSYDLLDTPQDQVYKGYKSEYTNVKAAVDGTVGQVMTKDGKIIRAYYGASNGGQTELSQNVWTNPTSYCIMKDDPYDLRNPTSPRQTIFFPNTISSETPMDSKLSSFLKTQVAPQLKSMGYSTYSDQIEILGIDGLAGSQRKYEAPSRNYTHVKATVRVRGMKGGGDGLVVTNPSGSKPVKPEFSLVGDSTSGPIYADSAGNLFDANSVQWLQDQYEAELEEWNSGQSSLESSGQGFSGSGDTVSVDVEFRIYDLKDKSMGTKLFTNHSLIMYYVEEATGGWNIVNARYGHGVGMSQRGAQQMATEGLNYQDILHFYYEGISLTNLAYAGSGDVTDITTDSGTGAASSGESSGDSSVGLTPDTGDSSTSGGSAVSGQTLKNTTLYQKADGSGKVATIKKGAQVNVLVQSGDMLLVQTKAGTTGFTSHENIQVSSGSAVLREDAALFDEVGNALTSLSKGERLTILGRSGDMYHVQDEVGQEGYIPFSQLELRIDSPRVILPTSKRYGQTTGKIRLYKDKTGKKTLGTIPSKTVVEVLSKTSNGYYNVIYNGQKGAVKADYLKMIKKGGYHPNPKAFIESYTGKQSASLSWNVAAGIPNTSYGAILRMDPAINEAEVTGTVKGQTVNLRKEASTSSGIIKQLPGGEKVTVTATVGDFYKVRDSAGNVGYVVKDWIDLGGASVSGSSNTNGGGSTPTSRVGVVRSAGVNVRASASTGASILGTLQNGEKVDVLSSSGAFYKVRSSSGLEGYVSDQYLTVQEVEADGIESVDDPEDPPASTPPASSSSSTAAGVVAMGTITGATVNMRSKASSSAEVITTIPAGQEVGIIASNSGYYKISYNGQTGYVLSTYVPANTLRKPGSGSSSSTSSSSGSSSGRQTGTVSVNSSLRLRSLEGTVLGSLANGAKVEILETLSDRYKISSGGKVGYVSKQYIKLDGSSGASSSSGSSTSSGSSSGGKNTGTITANSLRLRTLEGTVLGTLTKGTKVTIQETLSDRYKVTADGRIGYVSKQYVSLGEGNSDAGSNAGSSSNGTVTTGLQPASGRGQANAGVNLRATASSSGRKMGVIYKNEVVDIVGTDGEYYRVKAKGMTGYVSKQYIDKVK